MSGSSAGRRRARFLEDVTHPRLRDQVRFAMRVEGRVHRLGEAVGRLARHDQRTAGGRMVRMAAAVTFMEHDDRTVSMHAASGTPDGHDEGNEEKADRSHGQDLKSRDEGNG